MDTFLILAMLIWITGPVLAMVLGEYGCSVFSGSLIVALLCFAVALFR